MKENGKYQKNCELLLAHLYNLCTLGSLKVCKATTQRLTQCFEQPISTRQVTRYLSTLRSQGLIKIETTPLRKDQKTKSLYKLREIRVIGSEPKEAKHVSRMSLQIPEYKFLAQTKMSSKKKLISDVKTTTYLEAPKKGKVIVVNTPESEEEIDIVAIFNSYKAALKKDGVSPDVTPPVSKREMTDDEDPTNILIRWRAEKEAAKLKEEQDLAAKAIPEPAIEEVITPSPPPDVDWAEIDKRMLSLGYEKMIDPCQREARYLMIEHPELTLLEAIELQKKKDAEQAEEEFQFKTRMAWNAYVKDNATPIIRSMASDLDIDEDPLEALWRAHEETRARVESDKEWMAAEEKKEYSDAEWEALQQSRLSQELEMLAENSKYKDGKYVLTIFLGGVFNKEIDLLTYMKWKKNSPEFATFKEQYGKIHPGEIE